MKKPDLRALSLDELHAQLKQERSTGQQLRFAHAISPLENPMRLRQNRKTVARLLTEITRRTQEQAANPAK